MELVKIDRNNVWEITKLKVTDEKVWGKRPWKQSLIIL